MVSTQEETAEDSKTFVPSDIYDQYTNVKRYWLLLVIATTSILLPFTDSAYLPALTQLRDDLKTSNFLASFTFSLFTINMGIWPLLWGPLADYIGRKKVVLVSIVIHVVASIGCIFAPSIGIFLMLRVFEAMGAASLFVVGLSIINDIFPPTHQGRAVGLFTVPLLFGPIIGPVIGGAIASQWNWRAVFVLLAVMGAVFVILNAIIMNETMPYLYFRDVLSKKFPNVENPYPKPSFPNPLMCFVHFKKPNILMTALTTAFSMGVIFNLIANVLPIVLAQHGYTPRTIGLCFLPFGFGAILSSIIGGSLADYSLKKYHARISALFPAFGAIAIGTPIAILSGWIAQYWWGGLPLFLVFLFLVAFTIGTSFGGLLSYGPSTNPLEAGSISGALQSSQWIISGVLTLIGEQISHKLGYGALMTIMMGLDTLILIPLAYVMWIEWQKTEHNFVFQEEVPEVTVIEEKVAEGSPKESLEKT
eukprot:TRINITY_DN4887_c0_g1_i3.p1 TRINITY_DN4887_c0_g1~~TRINITY_DN4887_c0_g1_i3.p1  ORF type:complete len:476 (-),score=104.58 TRINITY_DN4887_c0_g1_i3:163-1590(-)